MDPCKETGKSSEKGNTDSPLAKSEDKENKPGMHAINPGSNGTCAFFGGPHLFIFFTYSCLLLQTI